jgi:hypothetical protein
MVRPSRGRAGNREQFRSVVGAETGAGGRLANNYGSHLDEVTPVSGSAAMMAVCDAGVSLSDVQIAARPADPEPPCATTGPQELRPAPQLYPGRVHGLRDITSRTRLYR